MVSAGIPAVRFAREKTAREYEHIIVTLQAAGEFGVVDRRPDPQVETAFRPRGFQMLFKQRQYRGELRGVQAPVLAHVLLVAPGGDRGALHGDAHRGAVVSAVEEK